MREKWDEVKDWMSNWGGQYTLGEYFGHAIKQDIKHCLFTLSRYKFVAKLLMYKDAVSLLELGCNEALGAMMLEQNMNLNRYIGIDFDEDAIKWNREHMTTECGERIFYCQDFFSCKEIDNQLFDVVLSLDVIEHIEKSREKEFLQVVTNHVTDDGIAIIGSPNIMMEPYASEGSKIGHINLYTQERLYALMNHYFKNVFMFNMNDEVVNTGFAPMACYMFAVCCGKRKL